MPDLRAIPDAYYQAARIDAASRWATFLNIELPKLQKVLVIAILLRFMQTFMIYTEPFVVTGGGPGSATTFLSIDLVKIALGQVDLGPAAAMSLVYNLITLTHLLDLLHHHDAAGPPEIRLMAAEVAVNQQLGRGAKPARDSRAHVPADQSAAAHRLCRFICWR